MPSRPSVSALSQPHVARLVDGADRYRVAVSRGSLSETVIDAGAQAIGGIDSGLLIAEICMGGLGTVGLVSGSAADPWPWAVQVRSADPVLACLGSQYAGWSLKAPDGKWQALGSGPARAAAGGGDFFRDSATAIARIKTSSCLKPTSPPPEP